MSRELMLEFDALWAMEVDAMCALTWHEPDGSRSAI